MVSMISKNEDFIDEAVKKWCPRLRLAFDDIENILNITFRQVWYLHTRSLHFEVTCLCDAYSGQSMFWGDLVKPPATIAGVDRFY